MLARKYDNYAWEEAQEQKYQKPSIEYRIDNHKKLNESRKMMHRLYLIMVIFIGAYLISVVRSGAMIAVSNDLVMLKQQEIQLMNKNNELKIEVEQLKGPERIIQIAEKQLGMNVARSNIYVKVGNL